LQKLLDEARREHQSGAPPRASRELFRALRDALAGAPAADQG
jgi:ribosomal 50S subunit-associated protein YjgA (DUF615 family)